MAGTNMLVGCPWYVLFQASLIFASFTMSFPKVPHLQILGSPKKNMPGTNTLAGLSLVCSFTGLSNIYE
jgi:hypothetical protein